MNEYGIKDSWTNKVYIPEYVDIYPRVDEEFIEPIRYMKNGEFAILCCSTNIIFYYTDNTRSFRYIKFI